MNSYLNQEVINYKKLIKELNEEKIKIKNEVEKIKIETMKKYQRIEKNYKEVNQERIALLEVFLNLKNFFINTISFSNID